MSRPFAAVETFLERILERPAARLFHAHPQPVQLERRIERAMSAMRVVASGQTYVPSRYRILLHPDDLDALQASDGDLAAMLAEAILVRAREQGQWLLRRPDVSLVASPRVSQGEVEVDAEPLDPSLVAAAATGLRPVELEGPRPPRAPIPGTGVIDDDAVAQSGVRAADPPPAPVVPPPTPASAGQRAAIPVIAEADTPPPVLPVALAAPPSPAVPVAAPPPPPPSPAPVAAPPPPAVPVASPASPPSPGLGTPLALVEAPLPTPTLASPPVVAVVMDAPAAETPVAAPEPGLSVPQPLLPPPLVGPHATIEVCLPDGSRLDVAFDGTALEVGRGTDNDIVIPDERVSRHHGRFAARHGTLVYTDLGSTNGSQVGGSRVREVALGAGDVVRLGRATLTVRPRP